MTDDDPGITAQDAAAITAFEDALRDFAADLNRLHIAHGAPSYSMMANASLRPRLTRAGLNEMLGGRRFTSLEVLLEFVRVITMPAGLAPAAAAGFRADPALVARWRGRWQDVKLLQRQAQPARKQLRATVRQTLEDATQEAEAIRESARAEAARIEMSAETDAARLRAQARQEADALLQRARLTARQIHGRPRQEGAGPHTVAGTFKSGGLSWREGGRLRPAAAAIAVAVLASAAVLAGDVFTATTGTCRPDRTQAADQLVPRAGLPGRLAVRRAAFDRQPASIIFTDLKPFGFPSSSPSADSPPTPSTPPTPSLTQTPSTTPTPTPPPTPSSTPSNHDSCAPTGP
ncbi:hypothetical protein GCM10010347_42550 [Streptomyces cirratus]|uniref:Uncharacterized protein n=1 Tax=Streptomyces cirratus TaxID=68187 RepID=A0ABQ3EWA1_9ACTN|nr:hypothetical protein [Streptomyces cirratus]GHB67921.1 hypothetical protein GCM10010347_42550 [Streptomyces cirratus]